MGGVRKDGFLLNESSTIFSLTLQDLADQDCNGDMSNLSFYKNEICFQPNGTCPLVPSPSLPLSILLGWLL